MTLSPELATSLTLFGHFVVMSLFAIGGAIGLAPENAPAHGDADAIC